jgi:trk system potassium uptake protein TrkA
VESNREKSFQIASDLKKTMVVQADGTEIDALAREGMLGMDAFIATTSDDENNLIACLLAKHLGIQKTIALVNKTTYFPLMPVIGIDSAVNIHLATVTAIHRFIRAGSILSMASFHGMDAEAVEFNVTRSGRFWKKPLKQIHLPDGVLIAAIVRGEDVIVPYGDSLIQSGDKVIVFALPKATALLEKIFS